MDFPILFLPVLSCHISCGAIHRFPLPNYWLHYSIAKMRINVIYCAVICMNSPKFTVCSRMNKEERVITLNSETFDTVLSFTEMVMVAFVADVRIHVITLNLTPYTDIMCLDL